MNKNMPKGYDSNGNRMGGDKRKRTLKLNTERSEFDTRLVMRQNVFELVEFVLQEGGALRFGLTMDKGALALGIYGLGEPQTKYVRTEAEFDELLDAVYHGFKGDEE